MTLEILGRREDQKLELKSKDALDKPENIARAVVGMLNAGGGTVWIGVEDEDGKAVAVKPVPDPEKALKRLHDYLLDALDPSPTAEEVSIQLEPPGVDPAVLVVRVQPRPERIGGKPYAFRKQGGWHFLRRVGARNHPMSRTDVFGQEVGRRNDDPTESAKRNLITARGEVERPALWVGLQPALEPPRQLQLDLDEDRFVEIALDPSVTGNRRAGWHFARASDQPKPSKNGIEWGHRSEILGGWASRVLATEKGELRFWTALRRLHHKGGDREIWPLALLEYPVSAFRIARVIYAGHLRPNDSVAADLVLMGVKGWGLRPGTPNGLWSARARHPEFRLGDLALAEEPDLTWEPRLFKFGEIDETPDRCGFSLVRRVYQAFGFRETDMPHQYDRETGKLILPE